MRAGDVYYLPVLSGATHLPTGAVVPMSSFEIATDKVGTAYAGKLSASWPIYTGGRVWQGYQISRLSQESVRREYDTTRAAVVLSVKQAYYDLLLAQRALDVMLEADSTIQKHVARVGALYR